MIIIFQINGLSKNFSNYITKMARLGFNSPDYSVKLDMFSGIDKVIIDPTSRLADAYMVDNNSKNYSIRYNGHIWEYPDWRNYEIKFRPDLWWNNVDGAKIGVNLTGGYLNHHHLFDGTIWIN